MLCFLESEATQVFSLRVPLFTSPQIRQSASPAHSGDVANQMGSRTITDEDDKACEIEQVESSPDVGNPYDFTDEDVDEMIAILSRPVAPPTTSLVLSPDIDADLWEALGMDVSDFVV